jgi:DNA-binding response OmpR family regulator
MKLLLIEDDTKVARFVKKGLEREGFVVTIVGDGESGLDLGQEESFDTIILDLMLPKRSGLSVLRHLRSYGVTTPILILTAKGTVEDRIEGLNLGADDYLVKPFAFGELLARIRALLRRNSDNKNPIIELNGLKIDPISREVKRAGKTIDLTTKEYALLEFLAYNANRALSRITISEHVWDYQFDTGTNFIDVYINRLRMKVDEGFDQKLIQTVRGYGYMLKGKEAHD